MNPIGPYYQYYKVMNRRTRRDYIKRGLIEKTPYTRHTDKESFSFSDFYTKFEDKILAEISTCQDIHYFRNRMAYNELKITTQPGCNFITETGVIGTENLAEVVLSESFLAFFWIVCFNSLVEFDYQKSRIIKTLRRGPSQLLVDDSRQLLEYGLSLIEHNEIAWPIYSNSDWRTTTKQIRAYLPNPFFVTKQPDYERYISKASGIFVAGLTFIILHELNHFLHGHHLPATIHDIEHEYEADNYALSITKPFRGEKLNQYLAGISSVFITIELIERLKQIKPSNSHPENYDRIWALENLEDPDGIAYEYLGYCIQRILIPKKDNALYETSWDYFHEQHQRWSRC